MRRLLAAAAVLMLLTACGGDYGSLHQGDANGVVEPVRVTTDDGRQVDCVVYDGVRAGGITCDWTADPE